MVDAPSAAAHGVRNFIEAKQGHLMSDFITAERTRYEAIVREAGVTVE